MSRSGYQDDWGDEYPGQMELYRAAVERATKGKRGQAFLRDLLAALDAMPTKELIAHELVTSDGQVCAMGALAQMRAVDVAKVDPEESWEVAKLFNIAESLAREVAFVNDDDFCYRGASEAPAKRWERVRAWVAEHVIADK